jgi:tetratricopeptide (TPR) repeat protein
MNRLRFYLFSIIFLYVVLFSVPASALQNSESQKSENPQTVTEKKRAYTPTMQERESLKVFNEILDVIESTSDRKSILPKIEELYGKIIREYPEAPLAQESYWKLLTLYVEEYSPPAYEKAETLYNDFLISHPKSILKGFMVETLGKSYYKNDRWDQLLEISAPVFREYIEQEKKTPASILFMYSEANYNLGNMAEAEKGYEIVAGKFPKLHEAIKSKARLEKIRKGRE